MGRVRGGERNRRAERVDSVIKINHSAALHSTGELTGAACSNVVGFAYLGAPAGRGPRRIHSL